MHPKTQVIAALHRRACIDTRQAARPARQQTLAVQADAQRRVTTLRCRAQRW